MTRSRSFASILFLGALPIACTTSDAGHDTDAIASTSSASTTNPSGNQSGSATSAPGSASDEAVSDSTPTMATAASTPSGTSDGSSSTGEACTFLICDDMMNGPPHECDNWAQDCPEGQKCTVYTADGWDPWNATKCVDVTGTDQPGELCTSEGAASGIDSCIKGAMCWGVDMDGVGTCLALCTGNPDAFNCPNNGPCTITGNSVLNLCVTSCDPLFQDCPKPAEGCYPVFDGFTCAPDASGEEGQANDPCEVAITCDKGLTCADPAFVGTGCMPGATGCCTPFCKFPDGPCPNLDQQCVQFFDPMMFPENDPQLDIGVCGVPG